MYPTPIAAALSGATERQLSYWRRPRGVTEPLLVPEYGDERAWFYSFRDVVALRAFVATREQVSLQKLRKAVQQMDLPKHHPSEYRILGYGNDVVVWDQALSTSTPRPTWCSRRWSRSCSRNSATGTDWCATSCARTPRYA